MNGLKFRYRPVEEVIREVESCGSRRISINDADFFGTAEHAQGNHAGIEGPRGQLAGGRHFEVCAG